jgi:urease accessory protein
LSRSGPPLAAGTPAALALLLASVWPARALAHSFGARFGDFYGGLLHPTTALDLAPPLVALGLLAGQNGKPAARQMLVVLPVAFVIGTSLGAVVPAPAYVATLNAASFLVLGLLLALDAALPPALLLGLGAALGLCAGLANGSGMAGGSDPLLFLLGSALAGLGAIVLPSAIVVSLQAPWQRIGVRVVGSWLAAVGAMILALPQSTLSG